MTAIDLLKGVSRISTVGSMRGTTGESPSGQPATRGCSVAEAPQLGDVAESTRSPRCMSRFQLPKHAASPARWSFI